MGLNFNHEETRKWLELSECEIPKIVGKVPRGQIDQVEVAIVKGGRRHVLVEANKPDLFDQIKKRKPKKWDTLLRLQGPKGSFMLQRGIRNGAMMLSHAGGGHHNWHVLSELECRAISEALRINAANRINTKTKYKTKVKTQPKTLDVAWGPGR